MRRPLTSFPEASVTGSPRWSPDGRQIAFDSWEKGRSNIFVVSPEGGSPRCLTEKTRRCLPAELVAGWALDLLLLEAQRRRCRFGGCRLKEERLSV